ncbi:MAG: PGAP1 family protein, partial [Microgenomates group bacterium GW2011_GWC1_44_10]
MVIFGAGNSFSDDFSTLDTTFWNPIPNDGGSIKIENNQFLTLSAEYGYSFPYLLLKNYVFPDKDYSIEMNYRFSGDLSYGNGIVFSDRELDNGTPLDIRSEDLIFAVWPINSTTVDISSSLCLQTSLGCINGTYVHIANTSSLDWKNIVIKEIGNHYELTIDNNTFLTKDSSRKISKIWIGNPQRTTNPQIWATIWIDYLRVNPENTNIPIIILPGFGGSWDIGAILDGTAGNNWNVPSFVKNYDGIMQSFRNAGYVDNTDLFIFPYDWRKPLTNLADDLKSFIDGKNLTGKIDLIGHSMGGLVARSYAQKYGVERVNKILTAGSPHLGVIDTYGLWEGAKIWDGVWWENVLLEIATEVNSGADESKVAAIRRVSPSIIDLFPTVPFLISGEVTQGIDTMIQKNGYLGTLNQNVGALGDKLTPFWSEDINVTKNNIKITTRSDADSLEGKWEDGKPIEGDAFGKTLGDGTVTKESAVGPFGTGEKLTGWHGDLLSTQNNIGKIFQKLELDPDFAVSSETDSRRKSFVAILRSPGTLEVCDKLLINCNDELGLYFPEFKLFILPGYEDEDLSVKVKESGLGSYTLHVGKVEDEGWWNRAVGNLENAGQVDKYLVSGSDMTIEIVNNPPVLSAIGSKSTDELKTLS